MAIYPKVGSYVQNTPAVEPPNIEAWTEQATQALSAVATAMPQAVRGISESLAIPLDGHPKSKVAIADKGQDESHEKQAYRTRREPTRRDSMKRREALLKGKEGSRQRRRWENDRLLNNPWAQPPLPIDWEVHPTYPRRTVPYYLAPLWDVNIAAKVEEEKRKRAAVNKGENAKETKADNVPRELRGKLKKAKAAKGLLQDLEEQVRQFVKTWAEKAKTNKAEEPEVDSEDEEIVFVGRNSQMSDMPPSPNSKRNKTPEVSKDHLVFDSPADDHGASFGRWLVHNIATYYGLRTWSITVGDPARREAYVGIQEKKPASKTPPMTGDLPRPLWASISASGNSLKSPELDDTLTLANGNTATQYPEAAAANATKPVKDAPTKYRHIAAVHSQPRASFLSSDHDGATSFVGFGNLMVIVLIVMNLRLIVENFMKYGVLICFNCHDYRRQDLLLGAILYALVPCHLFVAFIVELAAAQQAKGAIGRMKRDADEGKDYHDAQARRTFHLTWLVIAFAHGVNATLCLLVTTFTVYMHIHHPLIGTISEVHAVIVWLKNCSYAFTNRDLRHALLDPSHTASLPEIYSSCPYPQNVTVKNLSYFWWAPTLVYQPVYPRSPSIRWSFVAKRCAEGASLSIFIWLASAQYAAPLLRNSLNKMASLDVASIVERLMKLSTVSLIIWLAGFFALFQSILNALAEVMRFGDREFYAEWWNSPSVGTYWRTWNKPVYHFMRRHIYSPLIGRGWSQHTASAMVFVFSGFLHELLVGVPTHNILGVAFVGMVVQLPLISVTLPLEKMQGVNGKVLGNCIFWISFCLVGQPLAALLYFFAWQAKYGSVSRQAV